MTGESLSAWLALREAADARARSALAMRTVLEHLPARRPLRVLDLATGTGANIRYLSSRLPQPQEWLAVDRDPVLLAELPAHVEQRCQELGDLNDPGLFAGRDLVTASALLDLVSETWIARLAERCKSTGAAILMALTYDGRFSCFPVEPEDETVRVLFNTHQRRNDKGFGRAAGPDAANAAVHAFRSADFAVCHEPSDWDLTADQAAMQRELIAGWAQAAIEVDGNRASVIRDWVTRRLAHVDAGRSRIRVGHQDVAAWLQR